MTQNLVPAGEHVAKIVDYSVQETSTGKPMVVVKLNTEHGAVFWNGVIQKAPEGKRNIPMEALITMGLQSFNDIEKLIDGVASNALDVNQEVKVTVAHEEYNGKVRAKAQFINALAGATRFQNVMNKDNFKVKISQMPDLKAEFASAWQETGGPRKTPKTTAANGSQPAESLTDIPF
jgi:hypothetical protein